MSTSKLINIIAAIIAIAGFILEILNYQKGMGNERIGSWMVISALVISILNQLYHRNQKKVEE